MGHYVYLLLAVLLSTTLVDNVAGQCVSDKGCSGHGTCTASTFCGGGKCTCKKGFLKDSSTDCFRADDCTTDSDCGKGTCTNGVCDCRRTALQGQFCDIDLSTPKVCTANGGECGDHGECDTSCPSPTCLCFDGYSGTWCTKARVKGVCMTDKGCGNRGTCQKRGTCESFCKCNAGYSGTNCEEAYFCTPNGNECGLHGTCRENTTRGFECVCKDKYTGNYCQIPPCTATGGECGPNGECITCNEDNPFCQCLPGYGGDRCELAPFCTPRGNECKNGATCDTTGTRYVCTGCPWWARHLGPTCGASQLTLYISLLLLPILGYLFTKY